jgi:hypothetical protein
MTITRVHLIPGEDLHLLPGLVSPRLDQLLYIVETSDQGVEATHRFVEYRPAGVTVSFEANFDRADPRTAGIDVDLNFGEVTVGALPTPERLLDFLVIATVSDGLALSLTTHIRVRIHDGLRKVWLTPATLTVRKPDPVSSPVTNARFTILAEFSDGAYGDLTNWLPPEFLTSPTDRQFTRTIAQRDVPVFAWDSRQKHIAQVDAPTGWLAAVNAGTATIELSAPTLVPAVSQSATVKVAPPWGTPVELRLVEGPGAARLEDVPNVLLLPDGFTADEQGAFEGLVRQLVHRLRVRRRTRPFDLLKDRINYFSAWVASPEAGVSVLEEVGLAGATGGTDTAACVSTNVDAASVAGAWHVGAPSANTTRFLLNERDTAFHVGIGGRPNAAAFYQFLRPRLNNAQRVATPDLDAFLAALVDPDTPGRRVGSVWMRPDPGDPDPVRGKDARLLVFVCRYRRSDGFNRAKSPVGSYVCVSLAEDHAAAHVVQPGANGEGFDLVPDPIPDRVPLEMWSMTAHEICHTFSLGDEYGTDYPGRPQNSPALALPADKVEEVRLNPNVQARADLLTNGALDADRIKWLWPRIEKAGVLDEPTDPPSDVGVPPFRLRLERGHAAVFEAGDVVRLRTRPLLSAGPPSYRLRVIALEGDVLVVEPDETTPDAEAQLTPYYVKGTVVMAPRREPDVGSRRGDDLLLVHESALTVIDDTGNPLNALPFEPAGRPPTTVLGVNTPTPATNFEDEPSRPPRQSGLRVGLYENGASYDADVYRPTGMCFMRTSRALTETDEAGQALTTKDQRMYQRFCPVCRYALVDLIDPTQHGRIDRDFDRVYPE